MRAIPVPAVARRRLWLVALCLYAAVAAADFSIRLLEDRRPGERISLPNAIVAFAAGLFWPADVVARILSGR
jgi:hypothetical protein